MSRGGRMCDMCSSKDKTYRIEVEGSILNVCEKCSSFGKIVGRVKQELPEKKKKKLEKAAEKLAEEKARKETETMQIITPNYSSIIRKAREKLGLKQEELAKKIAEKESIVHKLESGSMIPPVPLARKLERFLRIALVETVEMDSADSKSQRSSSEGLTLGDLIKVK
jgi:putative transcription factor